MDYIIPCKGKKFCEFITMLSRGIRKIKADGIVEPILTYPFAQYCPA